MMDLDILLPCKDCKFIVECFEKSFEDIYILRLIEDEEEAIWRALWRRGDYYANA